MNLYIASIKMWFKDFHENPNRTITYTFEPDKINVITGDASTGKSSLLGIIDYLLLSDNPTIVENIINENVEFYGMNIYIDGVSYIIIRKAPLSERGSQDVYYGMGIDYPEPYNPTHSVGELRTLFANIFKIPERHAKVHRQNATLTFRHFLPFNYLTEDIISSANVYFDIPFFVNKSFETFLDFALEYANDIKCHNEKEIASELEKVQKELNQYQQKHLNWQNEERKYQEALSSIFDEAMSLNLVSVDNLFLRGCFITTVKAIHQKSLC